MMLQRWNALEACERARSDTHGAFVSVAEEAVLTQEPPSGSLLGGLPYAAKDNLDTRDLPTTANTPALIGSRRTHDSPVLRRLAAAGAQLIGKTATHELALGITTSAAAFPAATNPRDSACSPGGSSGGSGAAVAAGIVPFAIGTDTGGSISIPAAWCGVFGLRPTTGRWPEGGMVPLSRSRDSAGVIADSIERLAAVDAAVLGGMPVHARAAAPAADPIRIGVSEPGGSFTGRLADEVRGVWEESLERLRTSGLVELVSVEAEDLHRLERRCGQEIEFFEITGCLEEYLAALPHPLPFAELVERAVRDEVREALRESVRAQGRTEQYAEALATRDALRARYDALFSEHGLTGLLYPTVPITAPRIREERTRALGSDDDVFTVGTRNVNPGSVAGQPVVTLPGAGINGSARPAVGVSVEGNRGQDRRLLAAAGMLASILR